MRAVASIIGVIDLIDTIDRTKVHAPFAAGAPIDVNPGFRPRSTRPLRSLRHNSPCYLSSIDIEAYVLVSCRCAMFGKARYNALTLAVYSKALTARLQV
jgi:hypothetical protein